MSNKAMIGRNMTLKNEPIKANKGTDGCFFEYIAPDPPRALFDILSFYQSPNPSDPKIIDFHLPCKTPKGFEFNIDFSVPKDQGMKLTRDDLIGIARNAYLDAKQKGEIYD